MGLSWHMHYWYTAGWRAGYVHYMNGERNVYKLVFTKQCNGCGQVPTRYPTRYPTAYPTPTCATTCQLKQHQWKGGKKEKKVIVTHDRKLQFHYHNHDQHRCYKTAAGKCECVCTSANGGHNIQFHKGFKL